MTSSKPPSGFLTRQLPAETIRTREAAAEERLLDGLQLALEADRGTGSIYLMGYTAEILIKNAYYRFRGEPIASPVSDVRQMMKKLKVAFKDSHGLGLWAEQLIKERALSSKPIPTNIAFKFRAHVATIELHWKASLRYSPIFARHAEVNAVYCSVEWIQKHYPLLWS